MEHRIIGRLAAEAAPKELGAKSLAECWRRGLRISKKTILSASLMRTVGANASFIESSSND